VQYSCPIEWAALSKLFANKNILLKIRFIKVHVGITSSELADRIANTTSSALKLAIISKKHFWIAVTDVNDVTPMHMKNNTLKYDLLKLLDKCID
jgi:hypothetical protein